MTIEAYLTIFAILSGPVIAVFITRLLDDLREKKARRLEVFKTLMRTRRTPIFPEHVGALNLIELEFSENKDVIARWKDLLKHFADQHVRREEELVNDTLSMQEQNNRNEKFYERLAKERQALLAKLLHSMAKALKFKIEQLEIFEGGYTPQGWGDVETAQRIARQYLVDLYEGKKALPMALVDFIDLSQKLEKKEKKHDKI